MAETESEVGLPGWMAFYIGEGSGNDDVASTCGHGDCHKTVNDGGEYGIGGYGDENIGGYREYRDEDSNSNAARETAAATTTRTAPASVSTSAAAAARLVTTATSMATRGAKTTATTVAAA